jgi:membrane-associated protease RseP (regulator of RpoE activity)
MPSRLLAPAPSPRLPFARTLERLPWRDVRVSDVVRRLAHFWIVWSALLLLHEGGHALSAQRQGLAVRRVTVGMGPVLWRGHRGETQLVLRAVPLAGVTNLAPVPAATQREPAPRRWQAWEREAVTLAGGIVATLVLAAAVAALVAVRERATDARWIWGRMLVADAVVLTVFNFLPVPPLDGGRALLGAVAAWRGTPLAGSALMWVQAGGLALAVAPMTLWTRWTRRIDAVVMWWGAPRER